MVKKLSREFIKRLGRRGGDEISNSGGGGISPGAIEAALAGYAKEGWVNENYLSIEFFNRIFTIHGTDNNTDVDVEPNDLDTTITSIEAMFGFWTDYYVSALGNGGDLGSTLYLSSLADVALTSPISDDQVLQYNLSTGKWTNATLSLTTTLGGLTDVLLTSVADGQILMYQNSSQKWINTGLKTINGYSLFGDGNINVSGGVSGNYMFINARQGWDANLCYENAGLYMISNGSNLPSGSPYGALLFLPYRAGTGNTKPDYGVQLFGPNGDDSRDPDSLFYRTSEWNSFRSWQEVITDRGGQTISTSLQVAAIKIERYNEINSYHSNLAIWLNYRNNGNVLLCRGGGNVGIGSQDTFDPAYKLDIIGNMGINDNIYVNGHDKGIYVISPTASEQYMFGATSDGFIWGTVNGTYLRFKDGCVGVKTTTPSYALHVDGTIYATGSVTALSDARKKDVIGDIGEKQGRAKIGVEQIADAPAVQFLWKGERAKEGLQVGTLAQYWQAVLPEVVMDRGGELSMQYGVAAMVSAIVTARKVVDHERRITELERENDRLRTEIEQLRLN